MDADLFLADLLAKPAHLRALAAIVDGIDWPVPPGRRVLLTGMGSSWFAADTAARRLRRLGVHAVADLASVEASYPPAPDLVVVGITASGRSTETLEVLSTHQGVSTTVALTDAADAALPADHTVLLHAGEERGGVACRSYLHTLAVLLQLEHRLTGTPPALGHTLMLAAEAAEHLLSTRDHWLPEVAEVLGGPDGTWLLAPAERLGSALQGALMLREGPRRVADACETGDWNHVDVYLTKTLDYRALLFTGSRFDDAATTWLRDRGSRFVAVGLPSEATVDAEVVVRHPHDHLPLVALLTEVLVAELLAAHWWRGR